MRKTWQDGRKIISILFGQKFLGIHDPTDYPVKINNAARKSHMLYLNLRYPECFSQVKIIFKREIPFLDVNLVDRKDSIHTLKLDCGHL